MDASPNQNWGKNSNEDEDMEPLLEIFNNQGLDIGNDEDGLPYQFRVDGVTIKYLDLKKEYTKVHRKIPRKQLTPELKAKASWMRIKEGGVKILVEAQNLDGELIAKVVVQRERAAFAEAKQMNEGDKRYVEGEVNIAYQSVQLGVTSWSLSLDLDSIYSAAENSILKEVYALCPSNIEATNKFQLVTELYLRTANASGEQQDSLVGKKESRPFLLRTEPRCNNKSKATPGTPETNSDIPSPCESIQFSPQQPTVELPDGQFSSLIANSATVGTLNANVIKSGNRDIGYHIPLKDLSHKGTFKEGDVVGFFEDENQKSVIERLDRYNYSRAKLAGVITRSYYLEGLCSEAKIGASDLVCVIGIVKVRVLGMVRNGEQLYAYKKQPGVAATYARLALDKREESEKPFLIGQALESRPDAEPDQESLVPAFVSVFNGINCLAMNQQVSDRNENFKEMISGMMVNATKKINRRFFWLKLLLVVVLLAIGLALWQRYAPNTLLRCSLCKRGSFSEKTMQLSFNTSWQDISFTALEFKFEKLHSKIYKNGKFKKRAGKTTFRYFINYERCCNRGASYGNEYIDDTPTVAGPEILSVDETCKPESVKYFNDGKWAPLMTAKRSVQIKACFSHLN